MSILSEGAQPYAPRGTTHLTAAIASSDAIAISPGYYVFECTESDGDGVCLIFGGSDVAAASTTNGWILGPGKAMPWYVPPLSMTHFRHIRAGSANAAFQYAKAGD